MLYKTTGNHKNGFFYVQFKDDKKESYNVVAFGESIQAAELNLIEIRKLIEGQNYKV